MTKLQNIPHLAVIILSLLVSTYVCSTYLSTTMQMIVSIPLGAFLALFAHYYLLYAIKETMSKRKLHQSIIIAVSLVSIVLYMEYNGVKEIAEKTTINTAKLDKLNNTLSQYNGELLKVATSRRWQDIEAKRVIQENIKQLREELREEKSTVSMQAIEAEKKAQSFRFFSVIMLVLSCVASSCIKADIKEVETSINTNIDKSISSGINGLKQGIDTVLSESTEKPLKTAPIGFRQGIDTCIDTAKRKAYLDKYSNVVLQLESGVSIREIVQNCNVSKTTVQNVKRCLNNQ